MADEPGYIRISPKEMYETLRRVEAKVDLLSTQEARLNDHESRLRALESRFVGVAVAVTTVMLTGVSAILWRVFQ